MRFHWLAVAAIVGASQAAHAHCDPATDYSVKGEFHRSVYVGRVKVRHVTWMDENWHPVRLKPPLALGTVPGGFDPYVGAYYTVDTIETLKGRLPHHFKIFSENTEARTPMLLGRSYLAFLYRVSGSDALNRDRNLMIDYCGNSAIDEKWSRPLRTVRRLAASRGH